MRWFRHIHGDRRRKKGFLLLPKGNVQIRWLEFAEWEEEYWGGICGIWWFSNWVM
jgi:hypothetical protein